MLKRASSTHDQYTCPDRRSYPSPSDGRDIPYYLLHSSMYVGRMRLGASKTSARPER